MLWTVLTLDIWNTLVLLATVVGVLSPILLHAYLTWTAK